MERRRQTEAEPAVILGATPRLRRPVLFLAALSLLCSAAVGYLAYIANRATILDDLYQSRLRLARTLAAHYDNEMTFDRDTAAVALDDLQRLWNTTEKRFGGSWLTVVRADGWQALNTRGGKMAFVANVTLDTDSDISPPTVQALLDTHQDWVGQTLAPDGSRRLSAYAYTEAQGSLVAVHVPLEEVEARIQALTLPWAIGLGALTLALLLMAGALLEWQHRNATQALQESQRVLATLMSNLPGMVYRCRNDPQWTMGFVSDGAAELTGYQPADLIGNQKIAYADLIHPDDRQTVWDQVQEAVAEKRTFQVNYRIRTFAGQDKHVYEQGQGVFAPNGELMALEGVVTDVTERRLLEDQLTQAQKMEAVGRLAGGVAHDFNNLLMVMGGHCELLLARLEPDSPLRRHGEEIRKTTERATALTRQLLAFSRKQVLAPEVLDLNGVVTGATAMLGRVLGEDIELRVQLDPNVGRVKADAGQIEQVIMNLAVNARDAMPHGGKLTLETTNVELDEAYARQHQATKAGPYVMLAVSDTGHGMSKEVRARIFEPFFTTKEKGKGTGLGLATVYGIVKQSDGNIWVYSEPGHGTTFKVYLPRLDAPVVKAAPTAPRAPGLRAVAAGTTVLLVEDEEGLRDLVGQFLRTLGYKLLETGNTEEAIRLAREHSEPIGLLITDVVMPGMSGRTLAEKVAAVRPEIKVLYISGYPDDAIVRQGILETGMMFLQKPFTVEALREKLSQVLHA